METKLWSYIQSVKEKSPLVHNITNYVVMNNTANALLAIGASPIMAHAKSELKEMVGISSALVINIGTLDEYWAEAMLEAAHHAHEKRLPWVLDPVGAGATAYRNAVLQQLLALHPDIIRGNASEIMALAQNNSIKTKGVDSTADSSEAEEYAQQLAKDFQTVVCVSGATDIITDGKKTIYLNNGHPMMAKVTGMGCTATAITGAFAAVVEDKLDATVAAMSLLGVAGEIAAETAMGPGSLQIHLLDKLYNLHQDEFVHRLKISQK